MIKVNFSEKVYALLDTYITERFGFGIGYYHAPDFVRSIRAKGLLLHDILDPITPLSASEKVHAEWENSTLIKTSGLGHSLHHEEVTAHILDFLKS
jgi:pimeloyl-ACP methyl ester carboxylesterase